MRNLRLAASLVFSNCSGEIQSSGGRAARLLLEGEQAGWDVPAPACGHKDHPADKEDDQQDCAVQSDSRELASTLSTT